MVKRSLGYFGLFIFGMICGCSHQQDIPKGIIPVRQMEHVLLDLQMSENLVNNDPRVDTSLYLRNLKIKTYYLQILNSYGISKTEFLKSFKFYESHPDHMKTIFDGMLKEIEQQKHALDSAKGRPYY
ncbi:MAG: DUF4296 domain-containing protein [Chitinophagaceae bacterium]